MVAVGDGASVGVFSECIVGEGVNVIRFFTGVSGKMTSGVFVGSLISDGWHPDKNNKIMTNKGKMMLHLIRDGKS